MDIKDAFAAALKRARTAKRLTQEDFSNVSSRTYVSTLERGLKNPTLDKIEDLASVMRLHPLTLITLAYMIERNDINLEFKDPQELFKVVTKELSQLALL
jgi:transcriptional regulator with XRE-family HTH domain